MKLVTSTGDFKHYVDSITETIENFKGGKFKYINLEQTGTIPELMEDGDDWKRLADEWGNAAAKAGVSFVVSHAPCLHFPVFDEEKYRINNRALCRSIEICRMLGIERIVVHACADEKFSEKEFYEYNTRFFKDILSFAEKQEVAILTENWDSNKYHFSTGKEMRDFIDYMNHPLLFACWDTAHGNIDSVAREIGQYENIIALGDKLKGVHISDNFGDCHHHTWPFAGIIKFDSVLQGLLDVDYDGYFTFEASYTLLHRYNPPYWREPWQHNGETAEKLIGPPIELKKQAIDLLYEIGKHILKTYDCFEE